MKKRPVLTPPVQRVHLAYFLARLFVEQGTKRFHRTDVLTGVENFPDKKICLATTKDIAPFFEKYGFKVINIKPKLYSEFLDRYEMEK